MLSLDELFDNCRDYEVDDTLRNVYEYLTTPRPMNTAPKDGSIILVKHVKDFDPYFNSDKDKLTAFGYHNENSKPCPENGIYLARWIDGYTESDGWESNNSYWVPGWWFVADDRDPPIPVAPVGWLPVCVENTLESI